MLSELELKDIAYSLVGTPYNQEAHPTTHCPEIGFNCYTWTAYLHQKADKYLDDLPDQFKFLKYLRGNFIEVTDGNYQTLDIPMFCFSDLNTRHIGVMLDKYTFTHCSKGTNGVAVHNINSFPWASILRKVYRHK